MFDDPVSSLTAVLHIEAAAEGAARLQNTIGLTICSLLVRDVVYFFAYLFRHGTIVILYYIFISSEVWNVQAVYQDACVKYSGEYIGG